jgi:hypothetical protein
MSNISFTAQADLSRGQLVEVGPGTEADAYATASNAPASAVAYEAITSGTIGAFYAPGTAQVPMIASGTIAAGDLLTPSAGAGTGVAGAVGTIGDLPASGSVVVGTAETAGVDGQFVYVSFSPYIV